MNSKQSESSIEGTIRKRRKALFIKNGYISLFIRIILLILIGYIFFTQVFLITRANGNDMFPAIKDGDLVIAYRLHKHYAKDDVAVYVFDKRNYLGRISGRGGDVVSLDDTGDFLINGTIQRGEIIYPTLAKEGIEYPLKIEEKELFLLGDHRMEAIDSRDFGPIELRKVKGKVITILRRRGL